MLNPNFVQTTGLQNYWTFCNNLIDLMTNLSLYNSVNAAFTSDRFNKANSAMSLSSGYLQAPSGVYFTGGSFTIMTWIYPRAFDNFARIIDFGNGPGSDSVVWMFSYAGTGKLYQYLVQDPATVLDFQTSQSIQMNQWQHLSFVFEKSSPSNNINIYVNGVLFATTSLTGQPTNVIRTSNYIGKSNWNENGDPNANAIFDEIKIFSVALTQSQIQFEMTNDYFFSGSSTTSLYSFL